MINTDYKQITNIHFAEVSKNKEEPSLEERYQEMIFQPLDLVTDSGFKDYLTPNEGPVENATPHLEGVSEGFIVSVGTERSLFDLILSRENCKGLIVRDINHRVKAYIDFAVMMLRISTDREDFLSLTNKDRYDTASLILRACPSEGEEAEANFREYCDFEKDRQIFDEIKERIRSSLDISPKMKEYYLETCEQFAYFYITNDHLPPKMKASQEFNYFSHDEAFLKLQSFAKAGNIIATVGDIQELECLEGLPISVVDTSNVCDYTVLDLRLPEECTPRIIWTSFFPITYHSIDYESSMRLSQKEREEALEISTAYCRYFKEKNLRIVMNSYLRTTDTPRDTIFLSKRLISACKEQMVYVEHFGWLYVPHNGRVSTQTASYINNASKEGIHSLKKEPKFLTLIPSIVKQWELFKTEIYMTFMSLSEWGESFEQEVIDKERFKEKLANSGLLSLFAKRWKHYCRSPSPI